MTLQETLESLADATVGENSVEATTKYNQLVGLHNQFMNITSNRFTAEIKRGKLSGYIKTKPKVERGLMIYTALLNRLVK
jgi:hypothetical protein